jgi:hypothetical protein
MTGNEIIRSALSYVRRHCAEDAEGRNVRFVKGWAIGRIDTARDYLGADPDMASEALAEVEQLTREAA